jgi:hypothetical protein
MKVKFYFAFNFDFLDVKNETQYFWFYSHWTNRQIIGKRYFIFGIPTPLVIFRENDFTN